MPDFVSDSRAAADDCQRDESFTPERTKTAFDQRITARRFASGSASFRSGSAPAQSGSGPTGDRCAFFFGCRASTTLQSGRRTTAGRGPRHRHTGTDLCRVLCRRRQFPAIDVLPGCMLDLPADDVAPGSIFQIMRGLRIQIGRRDRCRFLLRF